LATAAGSGDADGALRPEYAAAPDDSHLNDEAYEALDPVLFDVLESAGG
jgi:hypothetical protein